MADLSEVLTHIADLVTAIVYPNGPNSDGIPGTPARIQEGWPITAQMDLDLQGQMLQGTTVVNNGIGPIANITISPLPGSPASPIQTLDNPKVLVPPVYGLVVQTTQDSVTISGAPSAEEFLTLVVDGSKTYSRGGATTSEILSSLLTDIQADYPSASITGSKLSIPGIDGIKALQGAPSIVGKITHRQYQLVTINIWAPDPQRRSLLSGVIDATLKDEDLKLQLPDSSEAIMRYERTTSHDEYQTVAIYRRDLVYRVEYATIVKWKAYPVTAVFAASQTPQDGFVQINMP